MAPTEGSGAEPGGEQPVIVSSRVAFRGHVFEVRVDEVRMPDGSMIGRDIVSHPGAVVMAALDDQGRVVLVTQYRHAVGRRLLELPAGTLGDGEEPLTAAKRELREEVGLLGNRWEQLGSFFSSPGFLKEELHVFLARDLVTTEQDLEDDEDIEVEWRGLDELLRTPGTVADAKTLAALLLVAARLRTEGDGALPEKE
jgi:8-oxo-dGTP pyrophosphatase MutT (NUDIX family)